MLRTQIRSEVARYRRVPEYFVGVVVLPVVLFAMFGLPEAGTTLPLGTTVVAMTFVAGMALLGAVAGAASFDPRRLAVTCAVLLLGTVAFAPMGSAIAYWARPRAVSTIVNLVFLPLSFLSGFFFPVAQLPQVLQQLAPWLPTYHFGQLTWSAMAPARDVEAFGTELSGGTACTSRWWPAGSCCARRSPRPDTDASWTASATESEPRVT